MFMYYPFPSALGWVADWINCLQLTGNLHQLALVLGLYIHPLYSVVVVIILMVRLLALLAHKLGN
jgi:hypothetical protein